MGDWSWGTIAGTAVALAISAALFCYRAFGRRLGERPYLRGRVRRSRGPEPGDTHWLLQVEITVHNPSTWAMQLFRARLEQPPDASFARGDAVGPEVELGVPVPAYGEVSRPLDILVPAGCWPSGTVVLRLDVAVPLRWAAGSPPLGGRIVRQQLRLPFGC